MTMFFLDAVSYIADSSWRTAFVVISYLIGQGILGWYYTPQLLAFHDWPTPDVRFGYSVQELHDYYEALGEEGCQIYIQTAKFDLCPYMILYCLSGSALTVRAARAAGNAPQLAYFLLAAMSADVLETSLQLYGCTLHPQTMHATLIHIAAFANRVKWTLGATALVILIGLWTKPKKLRPKSE